MSNRSYWVLILMFCWTGLAAAQPTSNEVNLDYYLPSGVQYDASIPTPQSVLGYQVGEWHVRHDQLVEYMYKLADASDRVTIEEYARTYEHRPLLLLTITSPDNQQHIDEIRRKHLQLADPQVSGNLDTESMPAVVYMGYSIHGNEPSGSNAALVAAYYLAAAQGKEIEEQLRNTVILLDPSFNPDGMNRFAHWANANRSRYPNPDPNTRQHHETWPGGRTNHYWFDLNRDWLLVQHPESQGRIRNFYRWRPSLLTDHHEMGTNSTFFFQPGIPSRTHPLTPQRNQDLTSAISEYHADILDQNDRLYFTKENYDDFYYGKGSTYPDINGSIGILFEQASSRGFVQESMNGDLQFPFTIKNQFLTTLSTLKATQELRVELLNNLRTFYREAAREASRADIKGYVFGSSDRARTMKMVELLRRHQVEVHHLAKAVQAEGHRFDPQQSFILPTDQRQYKLIRAMFEKRTSFPDSLFYDVSAWTIPLAFDMPYAGLGGRAFSEDQLGEAVSAYTLPQGDTVGGQSSYAYAFSWDDYYAPRALNRLLSAGVKVRVAADPFTALTEGGVHSFDYGSIMVPLGIQTVSGDAIFDIIKQIAGEDGIRVYNISSGLTPEGIDLGSHAFNAVREPHVLLLTGDGVSSYEAGEVWHLLDYRMKMDISPVDISTFNRISLDRYNTIVMVNGRYGGLSDEAVEKLKRWVGDGGTLVTTKYATQWAAEEGLAKVEFVSEGDTTAAGEVQPRSYSLLDRDRGAQYIGGSIFNGELDRSNPIGYGYERSYIPLFRNSTLFMKRAENRYATPVRYTSDPLASGYISDENLEKLKGTAAVVVSRHGGGRVISMTDDPNFRAYWYGTNKLFLNAIFFGDTISGAAAN